MLIVGFVVGGLMMAAFAGGISLFGGGSAPNTFGSLQGQTAADPTDPKTQQLLSTINEASNPTGFLATNKDKVSSVLGQLTDVETNWDAKAVLTGQALADAKTQIGILKASYERLEVLLAGASGGTAATIPAQAEVEKLRQTIMTARVALQQVLDRAHGANLGDFKTSYDLAKALITRNTDGSHPDGGAGVIIWSPVAGTPMGMSPDITSRTVINGKYLNKSVVDAAKYMDCAGFVSYVLVGAGALPGHEMTTGIALDKQYFDPILVPTKDSTIQESDITDALSKGVLKPGDLIVTGLSDGADHTSNSHAVMIMEPSYTDPHGVAESTNANGKNGPQYTSLEARAKRSIIGKTQGDYVVFRRPHYAPTPATPKP